MTPLKPTDKYELRREIQRCLFGLSNPVSYKFTYYINNGLNLCYCLEDCISIIPDFLFYQIKSVNIRDVKKHTEVPKPIQDYLDNNIHILEEIKEIYLMNMLE